MYFFNFYLHAIHWLMKHISHTSWLLPSWLWKQQNTIFLKGWCVEGFSFNFGTQSRLISFEEAIIFPTKDGRKEVRKRIQRPPRNHRNPTTTKKRTKPSNFFPCSALSTICPTKKKTSDRAGLVLETGARGFKSRPGAGSASAVCWPWRWGRAGAWWRAGAWRPCRAPSWRRRRATTRRPSRSSWTGCRAAAPAAIRRAAALRCSTFACRQQQKQNGRWDLTLNGNDRVFPRKKSSKWYFDLKGEDCRYHYTIYIHIKYDNTRTHSKTRKNR